MTDFLQDFHVAWGQQNRQKRVVDHIAGSLEIFRCVIIVSKNEWYKTFWISIPSVSSFSRLVYFWGKDPFRWLQGQKYAYLHNIAISLIYQNFTQAVNQDKNNHEQVLFIIAETAGWLQVSSLYNSSMSKTSDRVEWEIICTQLYRDKCLYVYS